MEVEFGVPNVGGVPGPAALAGVRNVVGVKRVRTNERIRPIKVFLRADPLKGLLKRWRSRLLLSKFTDHLFCLSQHTSLRDGEGQHVSIFKCVEREICLLGKRVGSNCLTGIGLTPTYSGLGVTKKGQP